MAEAVVAAHLLSRRAIDYGSGAALLMRRERVRGRRRLRPDLRARVLRRRRPLLPPQARRLVDRCSNRRPGSRTHRADRRVATSGSATSRHTDRASSSSQRWARRARHGPRPRRAASSELCDPSLVGTTPIPSAPTEVHDPTPIDAHRTRDRPRTTRCGSPSSSTCARRRAIDRRNATSARRTSTGFVDLTEQAGHLREPPRRPRERAACSASCAGASVSSGVAVPDVGERRGDLTRG